MELPPINSQVKASVVPFDKLAANSSVSDKDKVAEAAKQFEAIFLRQILGDARKTVITSSGDDNSNINGIYNDMINNQLADSISRSGAFGLAKSLQSQLAHQVLAKGAHPPAASPTAAPEPTSSTHHKS